MIDRLKPHLIKPARTVTPQCCVEVKPWSDDNKWRRERYKKLRPQFNPDLCQHESVFRIGEKCYCKLHASMLALLMWSNGELVESAAKNAAPPMIICDHPENQRVKGGYDGKVLPRFPLRYGSAEVEECSKCGWWRMNVHSPYQWRPGPYIEKYREDIAREDNEG